MTAPLSTSQRRYLLLEKIARLAAEHITAQRLADQELNEQLEANEADLDRLRDARSEAAVAEGDLADALKELKTCCKADPDEVASGVRCHPGGSYVFMREGHAWHGVEVNVIEAMQGTCKIVRSDDVAAQLLTPPSKRRRVDAITCLNSELW